MAKKYLATEDERRLNCPGVTELARRVGDYQTLAAVAETRSDPVTYLAGLIAGKKG